MTGFLRFPHTPHVAWSGETRPRDDKVLSPAEVGALLGGEVTVEEKVDGANVGFSTNEQRELRVQNRGRYLAPGEAHPQFGPLWSWLPERESELALALWPGLVLFGEWCYAVHTVIYDSLPDWFLGFDIYDHAAGAFWDTARRNALLKELRLHSVPSLATGRFSLAQLEELASSGSRLGHGAMEGIVVRQEFGGFTWARGKIVRVEFTQAIGAHWSRGQLRRNKLAVEATPPQ